MGNRCRNNPGSVVSIPYRQCLSTVLVIVAAIIYCMFQFLIGNVLASQRREEPERDCDLVSIPYRQCLSMDKELKWNIDVEKFQFLIGNVLASGASPQLC